MLEGGGIGCERTSFVYKRMFAFYCVYVGSLLDTVTVPINDMALEGVGGVRFRISKHRISNPVQFASPCAPTARATTW